MTKEEQTKLIQRIWVFILDSIITISIISAIVLYYFIHIGKLSNSYFVYVFMPGYILMMIMIVFFRLLFGSKMMLEDK